MSARQLDPAREAGYRAASLTYLEVGQTAGVLPAGYRTAHSSRRLQGRPFGDAVEDLLSWRVHERAGLSVRASGDVAPNAVVLLRLGFGPASVQAPCRVVYTINEPHRRGFAYGTLPGHPESGEEAFIIERHHNGAVTFKIRAFSRPASPLARVAGPLGHAVQDLITRRYLDAAQL